MAGEEGFEQLVQTARKAGATLRDAEVPYALGGGLAAWARGGPETEHDVDLLVKPEDAERAQEALAKAGMRTEKPPEGWLLKAYTNDDVLVQKLLALSEQEPNFGSVLELARSLREQVDWREVRERTADAPFAKAYFTLL